ncbi:MAG TPA: hypothetical protein VGF45_00735 [Polyangia bacterium]
MTTAMSGPAALELAVFGGRTTFAPREHLLGRASWRLSNRGHALEVRLYFKVEGGKSDPHRPPNVTVVDKRLFRNVDQTGEAAFAFDLPSQPFSFSGRLVRLVWAIELVVLPEDIATRFEIVIAPGGVAVTLV